MQSLNEVMKNPSSSSSLFHHLYHAIIIISVTRQLFLSQTLMSSTRQKEGDNKERGIPIVGKKAFLEICRRPQRLSHRSEPCQLSPPSIKEGCEFEFGAGFLLGTCYCFKQNQGSAVREQVRRGGYWIENWPGLP